MKVKTPEPPYVKRKTSWLIKIGEKHYKRMEVKFPNNYVGGLETHLTNLKKLKQIINENTTTTNFR